MLYGVYAKLKQHNNISKPKRKTQHHQPKNYFNFYLRDKEEVHRGACYSPQKHKLLVTKTKEDESQRFIFNKVKLSDESKDFAVKYYSTITISN